MINIIHVTTGTPAKSPPKKYLKVLIDYQGGDFSEAQIVPAGSNLDMSFTVEELNAKMLSLGLTPNEATSVSFMVRVTLSEYQEMYSNTVSLSVTPYSSLLDLSTYSLRILNVSFSTSANLILIPMYKKGILVAVHVKTGVITSSPFFNPAKM